MFGKDNKKTMTVKYTNTSITFFLYVMHFEEYNIQ